MLALGEMCFQGMGVKRGFEVLALGVNCVLKFLLALFNSKQCSELQE